MYSFSYLEPVCCSMSSSNCCFLTCIQISQKAGQVVWYSNLCKNFPQFVVIHTVKGFSVVNKAEVDVFLEFSYFFHDPMDVGSLISGSKPKFVSQKICRNWKSLEESDTDCPKPMPDDGLQNILSYGTINVWRSRVTILYRIMLICIYLFVIFKFP